MTGRADTPGKTPAAAALPAFHVMAKPTGARCNMACDYCFFLDKAELYPGSDFKMSDDVMERYIRDTIAAHEVPHVTIAWQGGEPTLMGLDFFKRAVAAELGAMRPGMRIENTLQTNGILLDDEWAAFLREYGFLVGLSLDGPRELHDAFRHDRAGNPVFDRVMRAVRLLQRHGVEYNILCTVNAANEAHALEVYRFFRDRVGARFIQFIPIVETEGDARLGEEPSVSARSVSREGYGRFLGEVFEEWVRHDVGSVFVSTFDAVLASYVNGVSGVCVFGSECGESVALEHNGDLYSCDHFVRPENLLGNIMDTPVERLVASAEQRTFGAAKSTTLPAYCRACEHLARCHGECPKNRIATAPDGEPGVNWLCPGLKEFFARTDQPMRLMARLLAEGREARDVMPLAAQRLG